MYVMYIVPDLHQICFVFVRCVEYPKTEQSSKGLTLQLVFGTIDKGQVTGGLYIRYGG